MAWLSETTAEELRAAQGDADAQKRALLRYWKRGSDADMTPAELIDFLGVSFPSILDLAGFTEEEGDAVMAISDALTEEEVRNTEL